MTEGERKEQNGGNVDMTAEKGGSKEDTCMESLRMEASMEARKDGGQQGINAASKVGRKTGSK